MSDPDALREWLLRVPGLEVFARLGAGASGAVYEAIDHRLGPVAVKVLLDDEGGTERFASLASVRHPNLVRLHEIREHEGLRLVLMERVDGVDLLRWVRPRRATRDPAKLRPTLPLAFGQPLQEGGLSAFEAIDRDGARKLLAALPGLFGALAALHARGHVHGDVRPENVLVERDGRVVLVDMGVDDDELAPAYAAPDDALGPASDVYAAGVVLFEALTGALPFGGTAHEVVVRKKTVAAPTASFVCELPKEAEPIDALVTRLLRRVVSQRPTAPEVLALLQNAEPSGA